MPIKHLILSGGGPIGLQFLGVLEHLNKAGFWTLENIETIYATSIGTMVGTSIALKYDWDTLNKYVIERPWHDALKINGKQIFDAFYKKGLYDIKTIEIIFKPLLEAKDLSLKITLKEFYEYTKIEFHLYTFEQNKFETVDLSYKTHPDLGLLQAILMSCAVPGLFTPTCIGNNCYIDGGVLSSFPLDYCLNENGLNGNGVLEKQDEMLGIKYYRSSDNPDIYKTSIVTSESSILEHAINFFMNAMNYIEKTQKKHVINNIIECKNDANFLSIEVMRESLSNQEMRREWIRRGYEDAAAFLATTATESEIA